MGKYKTKCPCDSAPYNYCNNAEGCPCADLERWLEENGIEDWPL